MSSSEELYNRLQKLNQQSGTLPRQGETDYRDQNLMAGARAAFRGGTAGFGEKIVAGIKAPFSDKTYQELKKEEMEKSAAIARQNPAVNLTGEVIGSFLPSTLLIKGAEKAAKAIPFIANAAAKTDTVAGRTLRAMGVGATEGGIYAAGQDDDILKGAALGTFFGGAAQATLGELFPAIYRGLGGTPGPNQQARTQYKAAQEVKQLLKDKHGIDVDDELADKLAEKMAELGPKATLADLDSAAYQYGLTGIRSGHYNESVSKWTENFVQRAQADRDTFNKLVSNVTNGEEAITPKRIDEMVASDTKIYSPEFERVIAASGLAMPPEQVKQMLDAAFDPEKLKIGSVKEAYTTLSSSIDDMVKQAMERDGVENAADVVFNARDLQTLKGQIDDLYHASVNPMSDSFSKGRAKDLAGMRKAIDNAIAETTDGYKAINEKYSGTFGAKNAYDYGREFMKNKSDPEDYSTFLHTAGQAEIEAFMQGAKYHLVKTLQSANGPNKLQRQIDASNDMRVKLHKVLPAPIADSIIVAAQDVAKFGKTGDQVERAIDKGLATVPEGSSATVADVGIAGASIFSPSVSKAAGLGAGRRLADQVQGDRPRIDADILDLLATEGPEAVMRMLQSAPSGMPASDAAARYGAGAANAVTHGPEDESYIPFN